MKKTQCHFSRTCLFSSLCVRSILRTFKHYISSSYDEMLMGAKILKHLEGDRRFYSFTTMGILLLALRLGEFAISSRIGPFLYSWDWLAFYAGVEVSWKRGARAARRASLRTAIRASLPSALGSGECTFHGLLTTRLLWSSHLHIALAEPANWQLCLISI